MTLSNGLHGTGWDELPGADEELVVCPRCGEKRTIEAPIPCRDPDCPTESEFL